MIKTRFNIMLGIKHPIIQEGIDHSAGPDLAAAVSEAGGLGVLAISGKDSDEIKDLLAKVKEKTENPFAVSVRLKDEKAEKLIDELLDMDVQVFITHTGSSALFTKKIKEKGGRVIHEALDFAQIRECEKQGVDAVIVRGVESGGSVNKQKLGMAVLTPLAHDTIKLPIIAAGGIVDGRSMTAALAVGAEGVQIGTRFTASRESEAHEEYKKAIIKSDGADTALLNLDGTHVRVLKNGFTSRLLELIEAGESVETIMEQATPDKFQSGMSMGNVDDGLLIAGQCSGMIKSIKSVKDVIREMMFEIMVVKDQFEKYVQVKHMFG